jgi:exopolysaccharide biosynthesis polyprenyl glycosylphosphotransferase
MSAPGTVDRPRAPQGSLSRVAASSGPAIARRTGPRLDAFYKRFLIGSDLISALAALMIVRGVSGNRWLGWDLLTAVLVVVLAKLLGRYDGQSAVIRRSVLDELPSLIVLAAVWALTWSLVSIPLDAHTGIGRGGIGILWLVMAGVLVLTRGAAQYVASRICGPERILIVGGDLARRSLAHSLSTDPGARIRVVGYLPLEDERAVPAASGADVAVERRGNRLTFDDLEVVVTQLGVERVLLIPATADSDITLTAVRRLNAMDVRVSLLPRLFELVGSAVEFDDVGGMTVLGLRRPGPTRSSRLIKRSLDVTGAGLALVLAAPVMLAVAVAIRLDSPGPGFFRQPRVGYRGRVFEILKFRSMVDGAEARRAAIEHRNETVGLFKLADDPRVTRVGRLIRRTSLDELPQLLNVLRGDMSLVGPRPLVLSEDRLVVDRYRKRLEMPPGMTGPWQILGPTRPPLTEMVKTDYLYSVNWSVWLDVKILLRTVSHIRAARGR